MNYKLDDLVTLLSGFRSENWTHISSTYGEDGKTFFLYRDDVNPETGSIIRVGSVRSLKELTEELSND